MFKLQTRVAVKPFPQKRLRGSLATSLCNWDRSQLDNRMLPCHSACYMEKEFKAVLFKETPRMMNQPQVAVIQNPHQQIDVIKKIAITNSGKKVMVWQNYSDEYDDADHFYRPSMRTRGRQAAVKEGSAASVDSSLADEYKVPTTRSKTKQQQHSSQVHQETKGQGSGFFSTLLTPLKRFLPK